MKVKGQLNVTTPAEYIAAVEDASPTSQHSMH
jgi:hypothetical protein